MAARHSAALALFLGLILWCQLVPAAGRADQLERNATPGSGGLVYTGAKFVVEASPSGASVFAQNCAVCHGPAGKGTSRAPSLEAVSDAAFVSQTVRTGRDGMPSFAGRLSDAQVSAVAGYVAGSIATVSLSGGDLSRGGDLYRLNCAGCHGATAKGGALVGTGGNAPALTGLPPAVIATAIRGGPGPMPVFPPDVFSQHDLASIVSYVQMLQHPQHPGGYSLGYRGPVTEGMASIGVLGVLVALALWIERRGRG